MIYGRARVDDDAIANLGGGIHDRAGHNRNAGAQPREAGNRSARTNRIHELKTDFADSLAHRAAFAIVAYSDKSLAHSRGEEARQLVVAANNFDAEEIAARGIDTRTADGVDARVEEYIDDHFRVPAIADNDEAASAVSRNRLDRGAGHRFPRPVWPRSTQTTKI